MDKFITKNEVGKFIAKMYEACEGKAIEITLSLDKKEIQLFYKERSSGMFQYINIVDEIPSLDSLINSLIE